MKNVLGVGVNDADYKVIEYERVSGKRKTVWRCPFYLKWSNMLKRCYSAKYHERQPTYQGCIVCEEWLTFSNFKAWMIEQDWQGKQLDKDLLIKGNKTYSPDTCIFVSKVVNTFLLDCGAARGEYLIGVYWKKDRGKFEAQCSNPLTKKSKYLGYFTSEIEAHKAWKIRKQEIARDLAGSEFVTDPRISEALLIRHI